MQLHCIYGFACLVVLRETSRKVPKVLLAPRGFLMDNSISEKGTHIMKNASDFLGAHQALYRVQRSHRDELKAKVKRDRATTRRELRGSDPLDFKALQSSAELQKGAGEGNGPLRPEVRPLIRFQTT